LSRKEDIWRNISGVNLVCFVVIFDLNNTFFFEKCKDLNNKCKFFRFNLNFKKGIAKIKDYKRLNEIQFKFFFKYFPFRVKNV